MNNLCCKISPSFMCHSCGMNVCDTCYAKAISDDKAAAIRDIMYHEEGNCSHGADKWLNENNNNDNTMVFGTL